MNNVPNNKIITNIIGNEPLIMTKLMINRINFGGIDYKSKMHYKSLQHAKYLA